MSKYIDLEDVKIGYDDEGEGEPFILLHGLGGDVREWLLQTPYFSKFYRVIAVDLPGHGSSTMPNKVYSLQDHAKVILGLVDKLGLEKINLLGNSMGGMVSVEFAVDYPDRLDKLVLVSTAARLVESSGDVIMEWVNSFRELGFEAFFQKEVETIFHPKFIKENPWVIQLLRDVWKGRSLDTITWAVQGFTEWDRLSDLDKITCPTLIIHGEDDRIIPVEEALEMHRHIKNSKVHVFKETGHAVIAEKADEFNELVKKFLQK